MKLLFENWRQYLNENLSKKEIEQAISDPSFNSAQSSQHRWGRGQPIIDYTDTPDGRTYTATYPDGTENSDLWPSRESKPGEDLETFLKRVEEPIQFNLVENWRQYLNEASPAADEMRRRIAAYQGVEATPAQSGYDIAMEKDPGSYYKRKAESDGYRDFNEETFGTDNTYTEQADHWETFEDGKYLENYELGWQNAQIEHDLTLENKQLNESLYYGTSTVFQEEIAENGIKSPSKWGDYSFAEENAMKIVEKHGGEPAVIQISLSEFKDEYFLLDESDNATIIYTEDFHIFMEKQEKKLV